MVDGHARRPPPYAPRARRTHCRRPRSGGAAPREPKGRGPARRIPGVQGVRRPRRPLGARSSRSEAMTWRRQVVSAPFIRLFLLASVAPVTLRYALVAAVTRGSEAVHVLQPGHPSLPSASSRSVHALRSGARSWLHRVGVRARTRRVRQSQGSDATRPTTPVPSAFLCEMTRNAEGTSPGLLGSIPIGVRGFLGRASSKRVWQRWFVDHRRCRCNVGVRLFG